MTDCIFCKISAKELPAQIVYEDETLCVFKDLYPAASVHLLIIPKIHIASLSDCNEAHTSLLGTMLALVPRLAKEHGCSVGQDTYGDRMGGYKTLINTGPDGGQEVYHFHIHVIGGPRPWRKVVI